MTSPCVFHALLRNYEQYTETVYFYPRETVLKTLFMHENCRVQSAAGLGMM
jgi:hypothetical protein